MISFLRPGSNYCEQLLFSMVMVVEKNISREHVSGIRAFLDELLAKVLRKQKLMQIY